MHRERTGDGQHVEVNLLSTAVASLANQASSYLATGVAPGRLGNRHPSIAPYETVRCRDGFVALAVAQRPAVGRRWSPLTGDARPATIRGSPPTPAGSKTTPT